MYSFTVELLNECVISDYLLKKTDREEFAQRIKFTRNYLTHYNNSLKNKSFHGLDLHYVCERIEILLRYFFLISMQFSPEEAKAILDNVFHFERLEFPEIIQS